jgi:hypothetical protein
MLMNDHTQAVSLPSALVSQVQAILQKDPDADAIVLVCREQLQQREYVQHINGTEFHCLYCVSELAMREALVTHSGSTDEKRLVLLSPLDVAHIAQDVLARIWRNEPQRLSPWRSLQQILRVRDIDPRLTRKSNRWVADALLGGYERIRNQLTFGEVLDMDSAWRAIAMSYLRYFDSSVDLRSVLVWSCREDVSQLLLGKYADDLMPLSLVCSILYCPDQERSAQSGAAQFYLARGKFTERYLREGHTPSNVALKQMGDEAASLVRDWIKQKPYSGYAPVLDKAEQILASLDMSSAAKSSDLLRIGLQSRFALFAQALNDVLDGKELAVAGSAYTALKAHQLSSLELYRDALYRAEMALRLTRWVASGPVTSGNSSDLIAEYVRSGGFCDWARTEIWSGDSDDHLNQVYQRLARQARDIREQQNQSFGRCLDSIARGDKLSDGLIPVEQLLDEVVTPLSTGDKERVLLLVLDGMSQAVYRQLCDDLTRHNWMEITSETTGESGCLVAALPTITEVSRCSLLSGVLREGQAKDEKSAFANHPSLKRLASTKYPPVLFHKQDLAQPGSGSLNSDVRRILSGSEHRITAVVINAIDDQLSSSAQVSVDWSFESIALLRQVMDAARESGRTIIMTSDHGHVLEYDSFYQRSGEDNGERYHLDGAGIDVSPLEVKVSGKRVVKAGNTVVLPWSETVRYVRGKNHGYHGGGTLQEVVIPLGVYVSANAENLPRGWSAKTRSFPDWWFSESLLPIAADEGLALGSVEVQQPKRAAPKKRQAIEEVVDDLFGDLKAEAAPEVAEKDDWVNQLVQSSVYSQIRNRVRNPISDEDMMALLTLLQKSQWQIMENQLSQELSIPRMRLRGFLSNAQRLLNVDGYSILSVDRDSQTIRLNYQDLCKQFELP